MMQVFIVKATFLCVFLHYTTAGQWRDIADVTFDFTTCNAAGRDGPSLSSCSNYYKPLIRHSLTNISLIEGFHGGQTFKFPKSGTYNVTVAGSSGGRGLCNIKKARGAIIEGQLVIQEGVNDSVLIMVGQKGLSPCDVNPDYHLCLDPPGNLTEANVCLQNWTSQMGSIGLWSRLGGGGGGGASMIWAAANSSGYFNQSMLPFMIAGGGGGTSLKTEYSRILGTYFNIDITALKSPNETIEEFYQRWIDAKPSENDGFLQTDNLLGFPGNRPNIVGEGAAVVSGAGGGWNELSTFIAEDIDGNLLSRNTDFAQGGLNCVSGLGQSESGLLFQSVNGGFGGGGGSCDEGGGGGGYGGGSVLTDNSGIPGSGGYSLLGEEGRFTGFNDGDGYVQIIPTDCLCGHSCLVEGSMFMCACPTSAILAPNGLDCYSTVSPVDIGQASTSNVTVANATIQSSLVKFPKINNIFSVTVTLASNGRSKRQLDEAAARQSCVVVWLNQDLIPVLISQSNTNSSGVLDYLSVIYDANSGNISESPVMMLNDPVSVAAGIVMGYSNCTISNISLEATIGTSENFTTAIDVHNVINTYNATFHHIVNNNLIPPPPSPSLSTSTISTTATSMPSTITSPSALLSSSMVPSMTDMVTDEPALPIVPIVVSVVGGVILLIIILVIVLIICLIIRKKSSNNAYALHSKNSINESSLDPSELQKLRIRLASFRDMKKNPYYGEGIMGVDELDSGEIERNVTADEHSYTPMSFERSNEKTETMERRPAPHRLRSRSRRKTITLHPKYGVMSPTVDFHNYNRERSDDDWEYDRTQLTYLREIGEGQFGKVLLMKAKNIAGYKGKIPVAVKTLSSIDEEDVKKFLEEIELMKKFASPRIVSLLGVNTQKDGAPLMILEYMPYGDLQSFLMRHKPKAGEGTVIGLYHQLQFAKDIASAMAFLESMRYVHRDVAARNCLVGPNLEVKVADFGLAKVIQEKDYYKVAGRAVLPVRWMAPESLLFGVFTSASDVWSYGVLLWEIASYGTLPFESCQVQEIVGMAQNRTLDHPWPVDGPEELMTLKEQCHHYEPENRPNFQEIHSILHGSNS